MQPSISRAICVGLLLTLAAAAVDAQELAGSLDQLRVLVKSGDTIRVTDRAGREVRGSVIDISGSSLELATGGSQRTFLESDITTIRQRRPDSLANGAKWGFAV